MSRRSLLIVAAVAVIFSAPVTSRADAPAEASAAADARVVPAALMSGLAEHAAHFEEMKRRAAFTMAGRMEELDGDGKTTTSHEMLIRSTPTATPLDRIVKVLRYSENGADKTAEAQKRATERRAKRLANPPKSKDDRLRDLHLPFLVSEQARYVFTVLERDAASPSRVRIAFAPKVAAEDAIRGSAWVDENERQVLSLGFSLSKNPAFVDHVEVKVAFDLATSLGRAPSSVSFDGRGGFLFIRKHYRGSATLSEPGLS